MSFLGFLCHRDGFHSSSSLLWQTRLFEPGDTYLAIFLRSLVQEYKADVYQCVTGTPVRKDVNDLLGLLTFLRYEPYASTKHIWTSIVTSHKQEFRQLFHTLALRHSKIGVRDELKLPSQRRYVITMPFTPIEEQHYQGLFSQMCEEVCYLRRSPFSCLCAIPWISLCSQPSILHALLTCA